MCCRSCICICRQISLSDDWSCGTVTRIFDKDLLDTPSTAARKYDGLYAVNAKFNTAEEDTATQTYEVVRIDRDEPNGQC